MTQATDDTNFAAALEDCVRRVRWGERLERCLPDYPSQYQAELARLVPLTGPLRRLGQPPAPEFQARLEARLLTAVDEARRRRPAGWRRHLIGWLALPLWPRLAVITLTTLVVLLGGGAGVLYAAQESLPDSPLYPVKQARESAELALTPDGPARAGVIGRQLVERGRELEIAVRLGKSRLVVGLLALRLASTTEEMVTRALALRAQGNPEPAQRALAIVQTMQRQVERLTGQAGPDLQPPLQRLRLFLTEQERRLTDGAGAPAAGSGRDQTIGPRDPFVLNARARRLVRW